MTFINGYFYVILIFKLKRSVFSPYCKPRLLMNVEKIMNISLEE